MFKDFLAKLARRLPLYREVLQVRDRLERIHGDLATVKTMDAVRHYEKDLKEDSRYQDPGRLQHHAFQVNSQNGEDGIIREIFRRINIDAGVFVEIGVGDGTENNTAFLLSQGWNGYWVDGNTAFLDTLDKRDDLSGNCLKHCVSHVNRENVTGIFDDLGIPNEFDLLSLDVDQNTFYIWQALESFSPCVVVVEYNATLPPDLDWKVRYNPNRTWDGTHNFGASLKALENLGTQLGYSLVGCDFNGINAFFVRNDLISDTFCAPFTAENHYEPPRYSYVHRRGNPAAILDRQEFQD